MNKVQEFLADFSKTLGGPPAGNVSLAHYSSFRIGGPADYFFEARTCQALTSAATTARHFGIPVFVFGGGYNVLFDDAGYRGLVIRNRAEGIDFRKGYITAQSGTVLAQLLQSCVTRGLTGLEFLAGIPGTVGGAVFGNAGAFGRCIGDSVLRASVLSADGAVREMSNDDLNFDYRRSALRDSRAFVLSARITVTPGNPKASAVEVQDYLERRRSKHPPWGTACAGSYFKNPCSAGGEKVAAGMLLEQAGAKGMAVGGAKVYEGHCNFIVNTGHATAHDVLELAAALKERVYDKFGVRLEEEVIYVPAAASTP